MSPSTNRWTHSLIGSPCRRRTRNRWRTLQDIPFALAMGRVRDGLCFFSSSIILAKVLGLRSMYSLPLFLLVGSFAVGVYSAHAAAYAQPQWLASARAHRSSAFQNGTSNTGAFSSQPGGSTPSPSQQQAPMAKPAPFQSKAGGQSIPSNSPPTPSATSTPNISAPPPTSPILASLVKARDIKLSLVDRAAALARAQSEMNTLPAADQAAYLELINASRQRLVVDTFLVHSGQVQHTIPAKTK